MADRRVAYAHLPPLRLSIVQRFQIAVIIGCWTIRNTAGTDWPGIRIAILVVALASSVRPRCHGGTLNGTP